MQNTRCEKDKMPVARKDELDRLFCRLIIEEMYDSVPKVCNIYMKSILSLGFVWSARLGIYTFEIVERALRVYLSLHASLDVPVHWNVPLEESWPADLWAIPLGQLVQNIR